MQNVQKLLYILRNILSFIVQYHIDILRNMYYNRIMERVNNLSTIADTMQSLHRLRTVTSSKRA